MSYKKRALALMQQFNATQDESFFDTDCWIVDFNTPQGKRWVATDAHATWTREYTLTECWKSLIETARMGVEDCPSDCDCFSVAPEVDAERVAQFEQQRADIEARMRRSIEKMFDDSQRLAAIPLVTVHCDKCGKASKAREDLQHLAQTCLACRVAARHQ